MPSRLVIRILVASLLFGAAGQAWAFNPNYSGDTIQDDIAREFNGATSYTIPLSAPTQSVPATAPTASNCEDTLQQEMGAGEIPTTEECYCPVGATQPVCSALPESDCPSLLADEEQRLGTDLQYYDCTCPPGANSPQCTSYYKLCEAALPSYQNSTNECTCSQTATSAVPSCESYYDLCEANLPNYQTSSNECTCSHGATSALPDCNTDYNICEQNAVQYENSSTTCTCSQTNTSPDCCTSTTTQQCSTTQQCTTVQTLTGYSCPGSYGGHALAGMWCSSNSKYEEGASSVPANFCPPGNAPECAYWYYVYPGPSNPIYTTTNQCNPVQSCTPVTTKTCAQEPG